jgi:ion channel
MKKFANFLEWHIKERYYYLFVLLALLILVPPFLINFENLSYLIYIIITLVIINCVLILFDKSRKSGYGVIITLITLGFIWLSIARDWQNTSLQVIRMVILALFFGFTFAKIIADISKMKKITASVVVGGIGAYLLLGLIGSFLFEIVELTYPNSFSKMDTFTGFYAEIYLSFVTISTLGYGDITPLTSQGQAVAILVAISGQLYLAIFMAMLVGKFLKDSNS